MPSRVFDGLAEAYPSILSDVEMLGVDVIPRGLASREIINYGFTLTNPCQNLLIDPARKVSLHFGLAEWLWLMCGFNQLDLIQPYNQQMGKFSDDGQALWGSYGPKLVEQLPYVLQVLSRDIYTRQAVLTLWRERPIQSKDVPCTVAMQFVCRPPRIHAAGDAWQLDLIVTMRSNDVWLGLPYDVFSFTMLQQWVAVELSHRLGQAIVPGQYHHNVGSLHLYDQHYEQAKQVVDDENPRPVDHWRPEVRLDTRMPSHFKAMFIGLTLMAAQAKDPADVLDWVLPNVRSMQAPWGSFMMVLAHKFHGNDDYLPQPWRDLKLGRVHG